VRCNEQVDDKAINKEKQNSLAANAVGWISFLGDLTSRFAALTEPETSETTTQYKLKNTTTSHVRTKQQSTAGKRRCRIWSGTRPYRKSGIPKRTNTRKSQLQYVDANGKSMKGDRLTRASRPPGTILQFEPGSMIGFWQGD
jgi:hypothetical protein